MTDVGVYANAGLVKLFIPEVGELRMSAEAAVDLALRLLRTANELQPGVGGVEWPPRIDWKESA